MLRKLSIWLFLYCVCAMAQAQYKDYSQFTDDVMCLAYQAADMKTWDAYLHSASFDQLSKKEQLRYLCYEYGYVATAIDEKAPDAKQHLQDFEAHINALTPVLDSATVLTYRSGLLAYQALMNKMQFISKGLESFNLIKTAYEVDSLNPMTLSLKGNVDFYAPKAFGGNKRRALGYFYKAAAIYERQGRTTDNWNYVATRLCIVQCEEKIGNTQRALQLGEKLLREYPSFTYLKNEYLPELRKKSK